jgi:hypothetical protein
MESFVENAKLNTNKKLIIFIKVQSPIVIEITPFSW